MLPSGLLLSEVESARIGSDRRSFRIFRLGKFASSSAGVVSLAAEMTIRLREVFHGDWLDFAKTFGACKVPKI